MMFIKSVQETMLLFSPIAKRGFFWGVVALLLISFLLTGCNKEETPPGGQSLLFERGDQAILVTHWRTPQEKKTTFAFPGGKFLGFLLKGEGVLAVEKPPDLLPGETGRKVQLYKDGKLQEERKFSGPFWVALNEERESGIFQWEGKGKYHYLLWNFKSGEKEELEIKLPEGFEEVPSYLARYEDKIFLLARSSRGKFEMIVYERGQIRMFPLSEEFQPVSNPAPYSQASFRMAVSPDGERLAFYAISYEERMPILHILLLRISTGNVIRLDFDHPGGNIPGRLSWSPDGNFLIGVNSANGRSEESVFALNGKRVLSRFCFSAFWLDSNWILFVEWDSVAGGTPKFRAVSLSGKEENLTVLEDGLPDDLLCRTGTE
ncbi:MAG: hypothetical protein QMD88_08590 [Coprothermobacterota bacterium]|nr:hypothetical protein [Coprothermobacterota bacterium]